MLPRCSSLSSPSRNSAVRFVIPGAADRENGGWTVLNGFMRNFNGTKDLIGLLARLKLLLQTRSVMEVHRLDIFERRD